MALVYRSVLEVEGDAPVSESKRFFDAWVSSKFPDSRANLPNEVGEAELGESARIIVASADGDDSRALRARLVETPGEQVIITTMTVIETASGATLWLDLSRSAENAWDRPWTPVAPRLLTESLSQFRCSRGPSRMESRYQTLDPAGAETLAAEVTDRDRQVPLVVVSPTRSELASNISATKERAKQLHRRLAGITPVYVLGPGAVSGFSKAMLESTGTRMDVHSGAIRVYLPGVGAEKDWPGRHRVTPIDHFLRRRSTETAMAEFVARPVQQAASHQSPPESWEKFRDLPQFAGGDASDEIWDEYEEENENLTTEIESLTERNSELELDVMSFREDTDELLSEQEDLRRRVRFLESQVREQGGETLLPDDADGLPSVSSCCEVVSYASSELEYIVLGEVVSDGAEELDEHSEPSWAKKALRAMVALDAYAAAKQDGFDGNFAAFCDSGNLDAIPSGWIALKESETTEQNARYKQLRTFKIPVEVDSAGSTYMEAHIKIEKGGNPAPRIHFHDDSQGKTGKIHVGWLGPHLDNKSKN